MATLAHMHFHVDNRAIKDASRGLDLIDRHTPRLLQPIVVRIIGSWLLPVGLEGVDLPRRADAAPGEVGAVGFSLRGGWRVVAWLGRVMGGRA